MIIYDYHLARIGLEYHLKEQESEREKKVKQKC